MSVEAFARALSCCALILATTIATPVMAEPPIQASPGDSSLCVDEMETEPDQGDPDPMPVADTVDGGCAASLEPIST